MRTLRELVRTLSNDNMSEALQHHIVTATPITDPIFRPGSDEFFNLISEARKAWANGVLDGKLVDPWLMSTDLGEWGLFEGAKVPLDFPMPEEIAEAEYHGRDVKLGQPFRVSGGGHKFAVYVRDPKTGNVKKVQFGAPGLKVKLNNPARRKSFLARHNCDNPGPKTGARYWSCNLHRYKKQLGLKFEGRW